jgi:hypothetical protein
VLGPQLPGIAPLLGVVPATGSLSASFLLSPGLVAPGQAAIVFSQGLFVDVAGRTRIGSPFALVILDQALDPNDGC